MAEAQLQSDSISHATQTVLSVPRVSHIPGKRSVGKDTSHCRSRVPLMDHRFLSCGEARSPPEGRKDSLQSCGKFKMFKSEKGENLEFQTYFCIVSWELEAFSSTEWCEGTMV